MVKSYISDSQPSPSQDSLSSEDKNVISMANSLHYIKRFPMGDPEAIDYEVRNFFYATYEVCTSNVELTKEEQERLGPLIKNAIEDMDDCLMDIGDDFDGDYGPEALILRSGYQFMVDNFKSFPDGCGNTLENSFKYFEETQSIVTLDEAIARWKERPYICEEDIHHTAQELDRPEKVPESHHWWWTPST